MQPKYVKSEHCDACSKVTAHAFRNEGWCCLPCWFRAQQQDSLADAAKAIDEVERRKIDTRIVH